MPLVDYDSSDEGSDNENEEVEKSSKGKVTEEVRQDLQETNVEEKSSDESNATIFSSLPKPRSNFSFLGDDNKLSKLLLNKKESSTLGQKSEGVKISVPSVSEFNEGQDEPPTKKLKPSVKGVGLFSVLPPPKNSAVKESNRTLVPHAVAKNQNKQVINKVTKVNKNVKNVGTEGDTNDDDDDAIGGSFFGTSLSESSSNTSTTVAIDNSYYPIQNEGYENTSNAVSWAPLGPEQNPDYNTAGVIDNNYYYPISETQAPEKIPVEDNPLELDEKALQILCGNKKKRQHMPMNIIDLSGEEIMPDSKEWLLKQFTEEKGRGRGHSHKKGDGPSSQQRRKHQITYLAYQAKANEIELQNQWANNRMSRRQTQSKYGF